MGLNQRRKDFGPEEKKRNPKNGFGHKPSMAELSRLAQPLSVVGRKSSHIVFQVTFLTKYLHDLPDDRVALKNPVVIHIDGPLLFIGKTGRIRVKEVAGQVDDRLVFQVGVL